MHRPVSHKSISSPPTASSLPWRLHRIVSGGQTGVDRAALDVAIELQCEHGGWCPKGRIAEDGVIPGLYHLKELDSAEYTQRTRRNVIDSDGTLICYEGRLSGGSFMTWRYCAQFHKPVLTVSLRRPGADKRVIQWIIQHHIRVLNIAGPRASKCPGIYESARRYLMRVLSDVAHFQHGTMLRENLPS